MAKLQSVIIDVVPHPDTSGSKDWWIVSPNEYANDDDEPHVGDSNEVKGKRAAIIDARNMAHWYVDTGVAVRAVIMLDGSEVQTYIAKVPGKKRRPGGKKRHGKFKLVAARKGTVLDRVKAASFGQARRKYRAGGHSALKTKVAVVRYGGKKRHAQPGVATLAADVNKLLK